MCKIKKNNYLRRLLFFSQLSKIIGLLNDRQLTYVQECKWDTDLVHIGT